MERLIRASQIRANGLAYPGRRLVYAHELQPHWYGIWFLVRRENFLWGRKITMPMMTATVRRSTSHVHFTWAYTR